MVGIRSFPFGMALFSGAMFVLGSVSPFVSLAIKSGELKMCDVWLRKLDLINLMVSSSVHSEKMVQPLVALAPHVKDPATKLRH